MTIFLGRTQVASGTQTAGVPKDRIEQWRGRAALITGASAGIGYEVAKLLVQLGMNVVGCSRNPVKTEVSSCIVIPSLVPSYIPCRYILEEGKEKNSLSQLPTLKFGV